MPLEDFIIQVYCLVDNWLKKFPYPLRRRGPAPKLSDAEVITLEVVGEFLGHHEDKHAWNYFRRHWLEWFPNLPCRTTYVRQCANLWYVKQQIQQDLCRNMSVLGDNVHRVDGFSMPVCNFRRAKFSRLFKGYAGYGYCAAKNLHYYGFQGVLMVSGCGVVTGITVMPANLDESEGVYECLNGQTGLLAGDKGYIRPILKEELRSIGLDLQTPLRRNMKDSRPKKVVRELMRIRRLVETVIGQLSGRFDIERILARDTWHITVRTIRKVLSHTMAVFINWKAGNPPLQLEKLIT